MAKLLQVDSSARRDGSITRRLTAHFAEHWRAHHPGGQSAYLDLAEAPLSHFPGPREAPLPADERPGQPRATEALVAQARAASTLVIGAPMYTLTVPTTLKAWLDRLSQLPNLARPGSPTPLGAKRVVVVAARGGSYAPGSPKAPFDFQMPLLRAIFAALGLGDDLHLVPVEMTQAVVEAHLAPFRALGSSSLAAAVAQLERLAGAEPLPPHQAAHVPPGVAEASKEDTMPKDLPRPPNARTEPGHSREQVHLPATAPAPAPAPAGPVSQADGEPTPASRPPARR